MLAEMRDHLAGLVRVREAGGGFAAQPAHDRNAVVAENQQRIVRLPHDAGEFGFQDFI